MPRRIFPIWLLLMAATLWLAGPSLAQPRNNQRGKQEEEKPKPLPNDPELMNLHRDFVNKAEKLAQKYERDKQWSKAKDCYEQILRLVPQYPAAKQKVQDLLQMEAVAQAVTLTLGADEPWKDTGVLLIEDRPITIRATGNWTLKLSASTTADGLKVPEELREFDPGCLIGMIVPPDTTDIKEIKPFVIGKEKQLVAPRSGRLFVQIYDNDVRDNEGELTLEIRGTFQAEEGKTKSKKEK